MTSTRRPKRLRAALWSLVVVVVAGAVVLVGHGPERPPERVVTVAGSFQKGLGCATDWQPDCSLTRLTADPGAAAVSGGHTAYQVYRGVLTLPAGMHEFKVALDGGWTESYGRAGAPDGANIPLRLAAPTRVEFGFDPQTHIVAVRAVAAQVFGAPQSAAPTAPVALGPASHEQFYFVMTDRFANGDRGNDNGGLAGDRTVTGFDPSDKGFFHGGDLAGLTQRLDYIKGLGTTAVWLTPVMRNQPVQGAGTDASAGYHGYWITDFTTVDPHLGSGADLRALVAAAHALGMKVYLDIIVNHTADVIHSADGGTAYVYTGMAPYRDASGKAFDPKAFAGQATFPTLTAGGSFPRVPVVDPAAAQAKTPAWLNDVTMYHNRGDSTFEGESSEYGDFFGLDDLFTERPEVVEGMTAIYRGWLDQGVDGFRIDTVKHVNLGFWQAFSPAIEEYAAAVGRPDFAMFGEVFDASTPARSVYTTAGKLPAVLDFGFQKAAVEWVSGRAGTQLADFFADDDWLTDADSSAYQSPTFLGNHDMGRAAMLLKDGAVDDEALLRRMRLATELLLLSRGQPVVYYGDEQGLVGSGGDKDARQDLFASQTPEYAGQPTLAGPTGSLDRYDTAHPLYRHIAHLGAVRAANPGLTDGAQVMRYAAPDRGLVVFSRVDRSTGVEYLVALNNSDQEASVDVSTFGAPAFDAIYGRGAQLQPDAAGSVGVQVPPMSTRVWRASRPVPEPASLAVVLTAPSDGAAIGGRAMLNAYVEGGGYAEVTFSVRPVGARDWTVVGADDAPPYRVFHDVTAYPAGTLLEWQAVASTRGGRQAHAGASALVVGGD